MDSKPLISVIIPVYNNEKYIEECINSVLNQSYGNFEIIAVNDGSFDSSPSIIENIADSRIKLISKENSGVSSARNTGIENSSGDYITFLDADDVLLCGALDTMLSLMNDETELVICSYTYKWLREKEYIRKNQTLKLREIYGAFLENYDLFTLICGRLYRREIIENNCLRFSEDVSFSEDFEFNLKYTKCVRKNIIVSDKAVYRYNNDRSGEHAKSDEPVWDIERVVEFYGAEDRISSDELNDIVAFYLKRCVERYTFWYSKNNATEYIRKAFNGCSHYINDSALEKAFPSELAEYIKNNDYNTFTREYYKLNKKNKEKLKFGISKFIAKKQG